MVFGIAQGFKSQIRAQSGNEITVFQGERISVVDIDMGSGFTKVKTDGNIGLFHKSRCDRFYGLGIFIPLSNGITRKICL